MVPQLGAWCVASQLGELHSAQCRSQGLPAGWVQGGSRKNGCHYGGRGAGDLGRFTTRSLSRVPHRPVLPRGCLFSYSQNNSQPTGLAVDWVRARLGW